MVRVPWPLLIQGKVRNRDLAGIPLALAWYTVSNLKSRVSSHESSMVKFRSGCRARGDHDSSIKTARTGCSRPLHFKFLVAKIGLIRSHESGCVGVAGTSGRKVT